MTREKLRVKLKHNLFVVTRLFLIKVGDVLKETQKFKINTVPCIAKVVYINSCFCICIWPLWYSIGKKLWLHKNHSFQMCYLHTVPSCCCFIKVNPVFSLPVAMFLFAAITVKNILYFHQTDINFVCHLVPGR